MQSCRAVLNRQSFCEREHILPHVVSREVTGLQVVLDTLEFGSAIKKTPVVVGNCTGFAVNRVFFPYTQAACLLVDLGLDPYKIDKAILGGFGMPMGPFRSALLFATPYALSTSLFHGSGDQLIYSCSRLNPAACLLVDLGLEAYKLEGHPGRLWAAHGPFRRCPIRACAPCMTMTV